MTVTESKRTEVSPQAFSRGNEGRDYSIYTRSMDAALRAKAASLFPHFGEVSQGTIIVDAGSGTGALAEMAGEYFQGSHVYALDISHELIERARDGQALTKLVFGDAARRNFQPNSVDIKFFSTSGHEIESYGGKGRMTNAVHATYDELKPGGRIVIRDFAKPSDTTPIFMQMPADDGISDPTEATTEGFLDYSLLSTRALFDRFHQEFAGGGAFEYEIVERDGAEYIKLAPEWAHEFYLRKDYTANWRQEIHEKYTYWTMEEAQNILRGAGFRDIAVHPDPNHYILENRLYGKIGLFKEDDDQQLQPIPFPATHMVVVGIKPTDTPLQGRIYPEEHTQLVDYASAKTSISYDAKNHLLSLGNREVLVEPTREPAYGSKKVTYWLPWETGQVIKVIRTDGLSDHAIFKAMYQSVMRENILRELHVPHARIVEVDPQGPPFRYYIQEAIPKGSVSAANLITNNALTETDITQMASYVNAFELGKTWQLDTNPFNWYRVTKDDGTTEMTYVDGKVYRYDELWEFRRVGLLQWLNPAYVLAAKDKSATIPRAKEYENLRNHWQMSADETLLLWKSSLHPAIQPN